MWKNIVETNRYDSIIRRIRFARWVTNASDRHSEYVIIIAFAQKRNWFRERTSILRLFVHCLSLCFNGVFGAVNNGAGTLLHPSGSKYFKR
jgi:hypothetical protein